MSLDLGPAARPARRSLSGEHPGETGTLLPPLIDHHVHLQLIAPHTPAAAGIAGVIDLGANPAVVARLARELGAPRVVYAGAFLTAVGGYPGGREWLPEGSLREIPRVDAAGAARAESAALATPAEAAVAEQRTFGASVVKVVLNADAGPVLDEATLAAIVRAARAEGLPVAVHTEGVGMAALAIEAGADAVVHTPWTESLPDALIARSAAAGQRWISTLDIHGRGQDTPELACAIDNLARFRDAGGTVLYGTDLGNGDLPDGVNPREITALAAAGLGAPEILAALTDPWPAASAPPGVSTFVPGPRPETVDELPGWLARACVVPAEGIDPDPDAWDERIARTPASVAPASAAPTPPTPREQP